MNYLYNPDRTKYQGIKGADCPFCSKIPIPNSYDSLVVYRSKYSVIMLNLFPYNPGHLLVIPKIHTPDVSIIVPEKQQDFFQTTVIAIQAAKSVAKTPDINIGMNMGKSSGGSVQDHVHMHIVPRFVGDTNFLAVIGETKVVTKDLKTMYDMYENYFNNIDL